MNRRPQTWGAILTVFWALLVANPFPPTRLRNLSKKPFTRVSKQVPGVHGKRGVGGGLAEKVGKGLAKGWRGVGEGLARGWRRVGKGLAKG